MAHYTTSPLLHFMFVFTVKVDNVVAKKEAHVFALSEVEADMLLRQKCPNIWVMLEKHKLGIGRVWMISGKSFNSSRPYVGSINDYVTPVESATPFTDFVQMYRSTIFTMPLPNLNTQLVNHKAHRLPTAEQFEILADETGELVERIKEMAHREFYAYSFQKAVEIFGRARVSKIVGADFDKCMQGRVEKHLARLQATLPNFAIRRYYKMTVGELLFFHDMNTGQHSSCDIYSGQKSVLEFPKRVLKYLCGIDSRFAELAAQESN